MPDADGGNAHRGAGIALVLASVATAEVMATVVGVLVVGLSFGTARDSFLVSNATIGSACAVCGVLIAWHRPRNMLGWLLLGAAVAHSATAAVTPWLVRALVDGAPAGVTNMLATAYSGAWPWAIAFFLPLALWTFPDGRLTGRSWSALVGVVAANAVMQVLLFSADPFPLAHVPGLGPGSVEAVRSWLTVPGLEAGWWFTASNAVLAATYLAGVVGLVVRYRRGDERTRLQLLWPLLGGAIALVVIVASRLAWSISVDGFPVISTLAAALIPIAMSIAVLRYRLLDIRLLWSRTLTYLLLTAVVVAVYLGLVEIVSRLFRQEDALAASVAATLAVAAVFNPVRVRLQRVVDRLFYGERRDPVRAVSAVTEQLATRAERPRDVLPAVCEALRLPWAALAVDGELVGEFGARPEHIERLPLRHAGETVGELRIGVRSGQARLAPSDRAVLELMALPIGVALRAEALSSAVRRSRQEIVAAREEERRRIRRDLHDGLASVLTGVAFQADAVVTLATISTDRDAARMIALGEDIRAGVTAAITDVRRLINELHPTALHDLGLVEAVRRHAHRLTRSGPAPLTIALSGEPVGELPAAVEVAAYRILTEALTNVARHSGASLAEVEIHRSDSELVISIQDNGPSRPAAWPPGLGLRSMLERAEELNGCLWAAPSPTGGRVRARLPLGTSASTGTTW